MSVNDRCKDLGVVHHLLVHSSLPRDHQYAKKLTPDKLMKSTSVAWVSTSIFLSKLMQRYTNVIENQSSAELIDRVSQLENELKVAAKEKAQLPKQYDTAVAEVEYFKATMNSLETFVEEEKKRRQEEEQFSREAKEKTGSMAVEAFRFSKAFTHDLGELTLPSFMFGYTSVI